MPLLAICPKLDYLRKLEKIPNIPAIIVVHKGRKEIQWWIIIHSPPKIAVKNLDKLQYSTNSLVG